MIFTFLGCLIWCCQASPVLSEPLQTKVPMVLVHYMPWYMAKPFSETLRMELDRAFASNAPFVQIATWNDWGEGTSIEPSREFKYRDLEILQNYRQESSRQPAKALSLPARIYFHRKNQAGNPELLQKLDFISEHLKKLQIQQAKKLLDDLTRQEAP